MGGTREGNGLDDERASARGALTARLLVRHVLSLYFTTTGVAGGSTAQQSCN